MWKTPLLPQNDSNLKKRQGEIAKEQEKYIYQYTYHSLEGVAMAKGIPLNQLPSISWVLKVMDIASKLSKNVSKNKLDNEKKEIFKNEERVLKDLDSVKNLLSDFDEDNIDALDTVLKKFSTRIDTQRPQSIADYDAFFETLTIPEISKNFQDDDAFVRMRVAGQNPIMLKQVTDIKLEFPIDQELFQSIEGFRDDTLNDAQAEERLYMIDYKALKDVKNGHNDAGQKYSYAPKALFAIDRNEKDKEKALKAIGILCGQKLGPKSPIFSPHDGYAWQMAKTIVNIADFNYHELISHLGGTHLVIEPFIVSTHRQFAKRHPVRMLLIPHFEGTILINWGAQKALVNDGGPFDKLFSGTMKTNRALIGTRLEQSFNASMLPQDLETRAVNNSKLFYPYRDDASKLWTVIQKWVGTYLSTYYMSDAEVTNDVELQAWAKEVSTEGQVAGFGDNESGEITTFDYLEKALTMIIFTASVQHAAVNFSQKDFGGYTPNMPSAGYTPAPTHKEQTQKDWFDLLPPINLSESQINLTQLLSGVNDTTLGDYGWFYFWDYRLLLPQWQFKSRLKEIELEIQARNTKSSVIKYDYLLPSRIPQSINI